MQKFAIKDVAKFSDENPDAPYTTVDPRGYVKHRVIQNDKCCLTVVCFRNGQGPLPDQGLHAHPGADEVYYVVEGEALSVDAEGNKHILHAGEFAYYDAGEPHNTGAAPGKDCIAYRFQIGKDRHTARDIAAGRSSSVQRFDIAEIGKYSDENPDAPYSEIAPGGYVRHRVVQNDKCAVTVLCLRAGQGPVKESGPIIIPVPTRSISLSKATPSTPTNTALNPPWDRMSLSISMRGIPITQGRHRIPIYWSIG